jgi:hypothetical protein
VIAVATLGSLGLATLLTASLSARTIEAAGWMVYALYAVLIGAFLLFGWLDVTVDPRIVAVRFGIGLVGRRFEVADIRGCERIRTRLWWGWGLHWTPSGWLYNVSGRDAVRLEFASQRSVMIGSDDAGHLLRAIEVARGERIDAGQVRT